MEFIQKLIREKKKKSLVGLDWYSEDASCIEIQF
jgi:hypothetical protein